MPLILVRHGSAGDRDEWDADDRERPLDKRGRRQAQELVSRLAAYRITEIHASPYHRCVQTVEPLAAAHDLELHLRPELSEERQGSDGDALLRELADRDAVVCGHGGLDSVLQGAPKWRKGAAFVVDRDLRFVEQI
jgi:8-oxo-dGTP diphosphatase